MFGAVFIFFIGAVHLRFIRYLVPWLAFIVDLAISASLFCSMKSVCTIRRSRRLLYILIHTIIFSFTSMHACISYTYIQHKCNEMIMRFHIPLNIGYIQNQKKKTKKMCKSWPALISHGFSDVYECICVGMGAASHSILYTTIYCACCTLFTFIQNVRVHGVAQRE